VLHSTAAYNNNQLEGTSWNRIKRYDSQQIFEKAREGEKGHAGKDG